MKQEKSNCYCKKGYLCMYCFVNKQTKNIEKKLEENKTAKQRLPKEEKETIGTILVIISLIFIIGIVVYTSYPLLTKDSSNYWLSRFDEQEEKLNNICIKNFGKGYSVATQTPSYYTCCKSVYPNVCGKDTETYQLNRPYSVRDGLFRVLK